MQNTDLEDFSLSRMILHFFLVLLLGLCFPFPAHSGVKSCASVSHAGAFSITVKKKPQMLQKFPLLWVWTCPAPAVNKGISLLWQSLAMGVSPFFSYLGCWCGRSQQWPPCSHTDGWGRGGLGRGAEEFGFGSPCTARQPGGECSQCQQGLLLLERRKPRSHNQSTALLLGQLNCVLPLSPTELGQCFTELGNGLWDVSQKWNAHCLDNLEKYLVFSWLTGLWKSLGWHAHCGKRKIKKENNKKFEFI